MGKKVLIIGESGTGKSASMRNFTRDELLLINVASKDLPFKEPKGSFEKVNSDNYRVIKKVLQETTKKVIVIDDVQYLMANEFMRRATEKGFDKFTEIAQNYWELQQVINSLPNDVIVYELSHLERDQNGNEKVKTIGKLLDEKITIEGMFSVVLKSICSDGKYFFQTQNSGHDTCKSPIGLFNTFLIDNDLKAVDKALREYYDLNTSSQAVDVKLPKQDEQELIVEEKPKTLAEKVADFKNNEPKVEVVDELPKRKVRERVAVVETASETPIVDEKLPWEEDKKEVSESVNNNVDNVDNSKPIRRVRRRVVND